MEPYLFQGLVAAPVLALVELLDRSLKSAGRNEGALEESVYAPVMDEVQPLTVKRGAFALGGR